MADAKVDTNTEVKGAKPEVEGKTVSSSTKGASSTQKKKGIGLEVNMIGLLSYIFAPLSSVIFLVTEKKSETWVKVKKDVMQSLWLGVVALVISPVSGMLCGIPSLVLWVYYIFLGIKAYQGEDVTVPLITDMVNKKP